MIAHGGMYGTIASHSTVKTGTYEREHTALTAACYSKVLSVPLGQRGNIVDRANGTSEDTLIWHFITVVEISLPISVKGAVMQTVIHILLHSNRYAVDTDF